MKEALLIIDPQRDFTVPGGALFVPGADADMARLAAFIAAHAGALDAIFITMDSHRTMHIAHPAFWVGADGAHPAPFTTISYAAARDGVWTAPLNHALSVDYLRQLEAHGKTHTIWPPHCLVGTEGYALHPSLQAVLAPFAAAGGAVEIIHKGDCLFAEHFSALRAEVESDLFPETQINRSLLSALAAYDRVLLAGECADICVRETLRDLTTYAPAVVSRLTVLGDCMSPLSPTFSVASDDVYCRAYAAGATLSASSN